MENKMIERINQEIEYTKQLFEQWNNHEWIKTNLAKIDGMIEMLEIATGKKYYRDNDGVHER